MTPELEGIKKTNPMLFKFAQKSTSIDEFIDKVVEYNKTTKENVSIPALTDFYNKVKGSTKEVTKGAEEIKPEVKPIPEKLEPLAKEAMKYKDAKEFEEAVKYLQRADVPEKGTVSSRTYNLLKSLDEDDKYAIDIKKFGFKSFTDFYNQAVKGTKVPTPIVVLTTLLKSCVLLSKLFKYTSILFPLPSLSPPSVFLIVPLIVFLFLVNSYCLFYLSL